MNNEGPTIFGIMFMYMIKVRKQAGKKTEEEIDKILVKYSILFSSKKE